MNKNIFINKNKHFSDFEIGDWTYCTSKGSCLNVIASKQGSTLKIGRFCSISSGVTFILSEEIRKYENIKSPFFQRFRKVVDFLQYPFRKGDIIVGHDVWIGVEATVLPGVTIGNGSVIGSRCVVNKDVPPYAIAIGNPMRIKRFRFDKEIICELQKISWWDWPIEKIKEEFPLILSTNIEAFIMKHKI